MIKKITKVLLILFFIYFDFMLAFPITGLVSLVFYIIYNALVKGLNKERFLKNKVLYLSIVTEIILVLSISHLQLIISHERGDTIINAVEKYKNDIGEYPEKISDLQPHYLENIPEPAFFAPTRYHYNLHPNKKRFYFSFLRALNTEFYDYKEKEWKTLYFYEVLYALLFSKKNSVTPTPEQNP